MRTCSTWQRTWRTPRSGRTSWASCSPPATPGESQAAAPCVGASESLVESTPVGRDLTALLGFSATFSQLRKRPAGGRRRRRHRRGGERAGREHGEAADDPVRKHHHRLRRRWRERVGRVAGREEGGAGLVGGWAQFAQQGHRRGERVGRRLGGQADRQGAVHRRDQGLEAQSGALHELQARRRKVSAGWRRGERLPVPTGQIHLVQVNHGLKQRRIRLRRHFRRRARNL
eukprot:scaffold2522_cov242-Pinguiococcus_pyrenoidosus.AAC.6